MPHSHHKFFSDSQFGLAGAFKQEFAVLIRQAPSNRNILRECHSVIFYKKNAIWHHMFERQQRNVR